MLNFGSEVDYFEGFFSNVMHWYKNNVNIAQNHYFQWFKTS